MGTSDEGGRIVTAFLVRKEPVGPRESGKTMEKERCPCLPIQEGASLVPVHERVY